MVQLKHKQPETLRKFFYHVVGGYLDDVDIWYLQAEAMQACGAIVTRDFSEYQLYRTGVLSATRDILDIQWRDFKHGGWKRPEDDVILAIAGREQRRLAVPGVVFERDDTGDMQPFRFHICMPVHLGDILKHDGGRELRGSDDYPGFLEAKRDAYAPYTSDGMYKKEDDWCSRAVAEAMIRLLRQSDDDNTELAACVTGWALYAFVLWHVGQYRSFSSKQAKTQFAGTELEQMLDDIDTAADSMFTVQAGDFTALKSSGPGTVSAALDRFMTAYSTGKFPLDFTRDKIQVDKRAVERFPEELRGCLEKGARSPREWQRAFAAVGDRWIAQRMGWMEWME